MKIAISAKGFDEWGGGVDFINHIVNCIDLVNQNNIHDISLLLPKKNSTFWLKKNLYPIRHILQNLKSNNNLSWETWNGLDPLEFEKIFHELKNIKKISPGYLIQSYYTFIEKKGFDISFPFMKPPSQKFKFKWLGYLYDFQHKYYPKFFDKRIINARNNQFKFMLDTADNIIVNANEVKKDATKFFGKFKAKIHVMPFSPGPKYDWLLDNRDLRYKYNISKPYFLISNQFWAHKNHLVAFKAFKNLLKQLGKNFQLICTGSVKDTRDLKYFTGLIKMLEEFEIKNDVMILGYISKKDQISLLKNSIAAIQPTLFEGGPGGGIAYDSISVGHPIIVSDIPVNLEIEESSEVYFFKSNSENDLLIKMLSLINRDFKRASNEILWNKGQLRMKNCGKMLLKIIEDSL